MLSIPLLKISVMATPHYATFVSFNSAKRQLQALVRKYNQASVNSLGYKLEIIFGNNHQEYPSIISYTMTMKNIHTNIWEVRRITSALLGDVEQDFRSMVTFMEDKLTAV